jgi:hypothetical protein
MPGFKGHLTALTISCHTRQAAGHTMCRERRRKIKRSAVCSLEVNSIMSFLDYECVLEVCKHVESCTHGFGIVLGVWRALDL